MTRFLLDRDVLSAAENPQGNRRVHAWIGGVPDAWLYISAIATMEARKGFVRVRAKAMSAAEVEALQNHEANYNQLLESFDDRILPLDRVVAERWGEMLARREAHVLDTGLAATPSVHGLVAATRNVRHFRGRGVRLIDPFKTNPVIEEPDSP